MVLPWVFLKEGFPGGFPGWKPGNPLYLLPVFFSVKFHQLIQEIY